MALQKYYLYLTFTYFYCNFAQLFVFITHFSISVEVCTPILNNSMGFDTFPTSCEIALLAPAMILSAPQNVEWMLLIGSYAQHYCLRSLLNLALHTNLTETMRDFRKFQPRFVPLAHPSPRKDTIPGARYQRHRQVHSLASKIAVEKWS